MQIRTIKNADLNGKKVLLRVDFNVPCKGTTITDDARIVKALPTIKYILDKGAKLIVMTHFGDPKEEDLQNFKVDHIAKKFSELLRRPVRKLDNCIGEDVEKTCNAMKPGDVIMLENVRFHKGEKKNDPEFCKKLAKLGEIYVNDAFGAAHRAHASTAGIADLLPSYAGFLMEKEITALAGIMQNPERPFVGVLGGAKVYSKIPVIENMLPKVDKLLIGGAMAFTFAKAQGYKVGDSLVEDDFIETAKKLIEKGIGKLVFPVDYIIASEVNENAKTETGFEIKAGQKGLDIGPKTLALFQNELSHAKTVIWNGPMGVFEIKKFAKGTFDLAKYLSTCKAKVVVGGGDSASAIKEAGLEDKIYHVSTGGGASLELLEGKTLPGVEKLIIKEGAQSA
ncbi:MAG: phosphoglycerate kinase [Candidatus Wallbacteria bacterium]|nr:phosphoglycerate kinase [Candidatus Wallbacteria bacterium]